MTVDCWVGRERICLASRRSPAFGFVAAATAEELEALASSEQAAAAALALRFACRLDMLLLTPSQD